MAVKMTEIAYRKKLTAKFGTDHSYAEGFSGASKACTHKCPRCAAKFQATPHSMLHYKHRDMCTKCCYRVTSAEQRTPRQEFIEKLNTKFPNIRCVKFKANHAKAKFSCKCKHKWSATPHQLLLNTHGCPECAKKAAIAARRLPANEIRKRLSKRNLQLVTEKRIDSKHLHVKCGKCQHEWSANVGILNCKSGCPRCYEQRSECILPTDKLVRLGSRTVVVQGYEPYALKYLVKVRKIKPTKIKVASEGIEAVSYVFEGSDHLYYPDIQIGNLLVEVKSTYTLLSKFAKNKAKAKACLALNYKFKLLVVHKGKTIPVPDEWLTWKEEEVERYVYSAARGTLRILSMDPGTANYGWAVLEVSRPFTVRILATGMLQHPITALNRDLVPQLNKFLGEIECLIHEFQTTHFIAERYMTRGIKGTTVELVSFMLGCIFAKACRRKDSGYIIPASQWKNEINKYESLESYYTLPMTDHQVDAAMIGLYGAYTWYNIKPFSLEIPGLRQQLRKSSTYAKKKIR